MLLLLKLMLVPSLVAVATLAGRRWGPRVGGWFTALPIVGGPVLCFYAIEQGERFASRAAGGALQPVGVNSAADLSGPEPPSVLLLTRLHHVGDPQELLRAFEAASAGPVARAEVPGYRIHLAGPEAETPPACGSGA